MQVEPICPQARKPEAAEPQAANGNGYHPCLQTPDAAAWPR